MAPRYKAGRARKTFSSRVFENPQFRMRARKSRFYPHFLLSFWYGWVKLTRTPGGGGGVGEGYSIKFYTGRLRPEVQTLTLKYTNFYRNGTPFIYLEHNCTPFLYLKDKLETIEFPGIATFFPVFSHSDSVP